MRPVSDEEPKLPVGADISPVYTNAFYIYVGQETARIVMGDQVDGHVEYDWAMIMPTSKAKELAETILALIDKAGDEVKRRTH